MNSGIRQILILAAWLGFMLGGHLSALGRALPANIIAVSQSQVMAVGSAIEQNRASNNGYDECLPSRALTYDGVSLLSFNYDRPSVPFAGSEEHQTVGMNGFIIGLTEFLAAETATEINPNKFKYLFGDVAADAHNTPRSLQNAEQLNRIGIQNTPEGIQILTEHLNSAAQGSENIINTFSKTLPDGSVINLQTRGSLLSGPGGFLKLESTWQVMPDGTLRFTTAIPIGGH